MENIVLTNNKDLRLVSLKVGLLSTLRLEMPQIDAGATNVEVIVTLGEVHSAYSATYDSEGKKWVCDVLPQQFRAVGKQSYEIAYKLGGKQFWDGMGWIEVTEATTDGLVPTPSPDPARYVVVTVNGYGAPNADGAVRIPKTTIGTQEPSTFDGFIVGDVYFNRITGEQWVLCEVNGSLEWTKCAGGDSGGVSTLMVEVTYAQLKSLVQSSQLISGMQYRIVDYVATTTQIYTQSANHPFDIIVTADSTNKLNEVARAIRHNGDTYFPETTKFESWKIWYCLDNDTNRFDWADPANGKGVVYRIIDEFGNDVPYDFKGIKLKRYNGDGTYSSSYYYTFDNNGVSGTEQSEVTNIPRENKIAPTHLLADETVDDVQMLNYIIFTGGKHIGNVFGCECYKISLGDACKDNTFDNKCREIVLDGNCNENIFGVNCSSCNLGYESDSNTFGTDCYDNQLGSYCVGNKFGNNCTGNRVGLDDNNEMLGSECNNNTFGNDCADNFLRSKCSGNFFGEACTGNKLLDGCEKNTLINTCINNVLESFCSYNTFGSGCSGNVFGSRCSTNYISSDCVNIYLDSYCSFNNFGLYCTDITFGSECFNNTFGSNCSYSTFGSECSNNIFGSSCTDNMFGEACSYNTFGSECSYNTFDSYCIYNTFGLYCSYNTFGSECIENTFDSYCCNNTFGLDCLGINLGVECLNNTLAEFFSATILQNLVSENMFNCTEDRGEYEYCRNIEIKSGVIGKEINIDDVEQDYHTEIRPANSITISI